MNTVIDRVPTYEGRIKLTVVNAAEGTYDMERVDVPTVVGTPINKALFDSIAADLGMITPPITSDQTKIANSTNVACFGSLVAAGLLSTSSATTNSFVTTILSINSAVICSVQNDAVTISDLPTQHGVLYLMKGSSNAYISGYFMSSAGRLYRYAYSSTQTSVRGWSEMATKSYVDGLIGEIDTVLDSINGEVV